MGSEGASCNAGLIREVGAGLFLPFLGKHQRFKFNAGGYRKPVKRA